MTLRHVFVMALAAALPGASACADSVRRSVGGIPFDLALPKGHCVLEDSNSHDAQFIKITSTLFEAAGKTLIVATARCDSRAKLRAGHASRLTNYAAYYVPAPWLNTTLNGHKAALRKEVCNEMRKQGQEAPPDLKDRVAKAAREMNTKIGVTSTKLIGVLDEDDHGCYTGLLIGTKDAGGKVTLVSSVVTSTVLHSKGLFLAYYNDYAGPETARTGVEASKATAAELDRTNPE